MDYVIARIPLDARHLATVRLGHLEATVELSLDVAGEVVPLFTMVLEAASAAALAGALSTGAAMLHTYLIDQMRHAKQEHKH